MFKYILVPAPGTEQHDAAFRTALWFARFASGHLEFLHVRFDVEKLEIFMSTGDFAGGAGVGSVVDSLQHDIGARHDRAKAAVEEFCAREHVALSDTPVPGAASATFRVQTGDEARLLATAARVADLTVLGRTRDGEAVTMDILEAVLLDSGRPLLIASAQPPPTHLGRHIAIAWKDTPEAARAVASVTPMLLNAAKVTIITVQEDTPGDTDACERLHHALLWHNAATTLRVVPPAGRDPGEALLATAGEIGADLLVMGGYSHSRVREVVFGGVTRHVLRSATLPVLMAH